MLQSIRIDDLCRSPDENKCVLAPQQAIVKAQVRLVFLQIETDRLAREMEYPNCANQYIFWIRRRRFKM